MKNAVIVLAPIKLAAGKTEDDLLVASNVFQKDFVDHEPGVLRRELIQISETEYMDIIQFKSEQDALQVMEKEQNSSVCHAFFAVMDLGESDGAEDIVFHRSLATYEKR